MDPGPLRDLLTAVVGTGAGVLSGVFGVGGTVISTPGIRLLGASAIASVGTTLPSVIPGAVSGTVRYARSGLIDWRIVARAAPLGVVASVAGALLTDLIPGNGHPLMLATAALLAFTAWRMAVPRGVHRHTPGDEADADVRTPSGPPPAAQPVSGAVVALVGVISGLLSGLLGIGGGVVLVPGFNQYARLDVKQSIATSLVCVGVFAIPGTITHGLLGEIDWRFALLLAVGIVPGAQVGAALAVRARTRTLRVVVSTFLAGVAVLYAVSETVAWVH